MKKKQKTLDLSAIETPTPEFKQQVLCHFDTLGNIANWANARDVQTIAKHAFAILLKSGATKNATIPLPEDVVLTALSSMLSERSQRQDSSRNQLDSFYDCGLAQMQNRQAPPPPSAATTSTIATTTPQAEAPPKAADQTPFASAAPELKRDSGVSDAVWDQLQQDQRAAQLKEEQYQQLLKVNQNSKEDLKLLEQKEEALERGFQQAVQQDQDQAALQEAKRLREEARLEHEEERRALEELVEEIERKRRAEEEERRKEAQAQQKLREMGVCPVGYRWIKQASGYRCAGGSHFVSEAELGL